jgi:hypothetical protein
VAAGVRGWDLQAATCALLAERGWPTPIGEPGTLRGYVHGPAGVGYDSRVSSFKKEAGEGDARSRRRRDPRAGLYEPGRAASASLEDLVHLSDSGAESLTPWPYDLDPVAWR